MRETVGSLRLYFLIAGAAGGYVNIVGLLRLPGALSWVTFAYPFGLVVGVLLGVAGLALAAVYLFLALRLEALVAANPTLALRLILVGGGCIALSAFVDALMGYFQGAGGGVVGLLIVWYLYTNVRRLAATASEDALQEVAAGSGGPLA